jgi:hypothetical protein
LTNGKPQILTYDSDKKNQAKRRAEALKYYKGTAEKGKESLDEYPYASTMEGGAGASVLPVPIGEQSTQGGQIGGLIVGKKMQTGDQFFVVPVPKEQEPQKVPQEDFTPIIIRVLQNLLQRGLPPIIWPPGFNPLPQPGAGPVIAANGDQNKDNQQ